MTGRGEGRDAPHPGSAGGSGAGSGRVAALLCGLLPGVLAGTQVAGLLFFLNPHLPFEPRTVLRGVGYYSLLLGAATLLLHLPWAWRRPGRVRRFLPISVTVVLAAASVTAWIHASYFSFFLPPGINRRLLKAAIWLSLATLICFYTVLVHRLRQRPYGRRSQLLFLLVSLASVYVVVERREAFRPEPGPAPRATTFEGSTRPNLCVIGVDSATLDAILPLEERGRLPFFGKILREGSHARLKPLLPVRRTALWTTLGTGKYPYFHGVVGESSYPAGFLAPGARLTLLPLGIGFEGWGLRGTSRPIDSRALRVRPLWQILSRLGAPTGTVGWPLTSPPGEGIEITVSERFFALGGQPEEVSPAELAERARLFETRPAEIDPAIASRFGSEPPPAVLRALARDLWIRDLGIFLIDQEPRLEAFFLQLPGLAEVSRRYFGGFSAVQFRGVQDPRSVEAAQLVSAYYAQLDELLAGFWELLPEPRLLVVVSVHGVEEARGLREARRRLLRRSPLDGYTDGGPEGVLTFLGDGIEPGAMLRPAELVDLVPTLLYGLGFPIARDLDGAVLTDAFETGFLARHPLTFVPSYETFAPPTAEP